MYRLNFLMAFLVLTACSEGDSSIGNTGSSRTYTVDEFLKQPSLRQQFIAVCGNNPGHIGKSANCVNVRRAEHIASAGTTIPSFVP